MAARPRAAGAASQRVVDSIARLSAQLEEWGAQEESAHFRSHRTTPQDWGVAAEVGAIELVPWLPPERLAQMHEGATQRGFASRAVVPRRRPVVKCRFSLSDVGNEM